MTFETSIKRISIHFKKIGFDLVECEDLGMFKSAHFSNIVYALSYLYDRGGIELIAEIRNEKRFNIVRLLNWLYNERDKYKILEIGELDEDKTIKYYGDIFLKEFEFIDHFLTTASDLDIKAFEENQSYEVAEHWRQFFKDKGIPIPEGLKTILDKHK
jgi:hypothetical protein